VLVALVLLLEDELAIGSCGRGFELSRSSTVMPWGTLPKSWLTRSFSPASTVPWLSSPPLAIAKTIPTSTATVITPATT
jgi:hypothetical protein